MANQNSIPYHVQLDIPVFITDILIQDHLKDPDRMLTFVVEKESAVPSIADRSTVAIFRFKPKKQQHENKVHY
jgi:hypothetical protein